MKKILNHKYLFFCLLAVIFTVACESESTSYEEQIYVYDFEPVELISPNINSKLGFFKKENTKNLTLSTRLTINMKIPDHIINTRDYEVFESFMIEHEDIIKGELTYYLNGIEDRSFPLDKSIQSRSSISQKMGDPYPKRNECSYEGIRQCAQYNIYEGKNTIQKMFCAFNGPVCILEEAAACTSRNCFGDAAPNEN